MRILWSLLLALLVSACASTKDSVAEAPALNPTSPQGELSDSNLGDVYHGMVRQFVESEESIQEAYALVRERISQAPDSNTALQWQAVLQRMQEADRAAREGRLQAFKVWDKVLEQGDQLAKLDPKEFLKTLESIEEVEASRLLK